MLAELTASRSNVKKLEDELQALTQKGPSRRSSLTEMKAGAGAFQQVAGKGAKASCWKEESVEELHAARQENEQLRGVVESICGGLGQVQGLWPRGLPVPLSNHLQGEVAQRESMEAMGNFLTRTRTRTRTRLELEAMGNFLERLLLSSKVMLSEESRSSL